MVLKNILQWFNSLITAMIDTGFAGSTFTMACTVITEDDRRIE
jgi:hypothetical protein